MPTLESLLSQGSPVRNLHPWPGSVVERATWEAAAARLAEGQLDLLGLWAEADAVRMALWDATDRNAGILGLQCGRSRYPSIGRIHPPALRLERAARDLFGLEAEGLPDQRPWLDHGVWGTGTPLAAQPAAPCSPHYAFLAAEGEGLHHVQVGPVHAGIIEPGHFRFSANGETVVRLEERLGYVHKGIERLLQGADLARATRLAGRVSGDSTVAYSFAFARAVEAALALEVPPRAVWLRALMAELERLANHLGDIGAICNDASFALMLAHCGVLRERVLRAADIAFGHRLMRDRIVPGGVTTDLGKEGEVALNTLVGDIRKRWRALIELYENTASLQDRTVGTGILKTSLARQYAAGGFVGRASGRNFDTRRDIRYAPYEELRFEVPVLEKGDVDARVWIRIYEVEQSLSLVEQILERIPEGPMLHATVEVGDASEGVGIVEGFRGDVLVWLRVDASGRIARCHLRDPSWFQWPLLEAAIEGNIVADFPLCNKSFNCSYSGHDL